MNYILRTPIPPVFGDGGTLKKIIKIVKTIWNVISDKPSKEASQQDSINDNASLENIDRITQIFSDFKERVHQRAEEIESSIKEEVGFCLDEMRQLISDNQEIGKKYGIGIDRLEKKLDKIMLRVDGIIDHEISKRVSLDNNECKNIMKMIPGEKKERALQTLFDSAIRNALEIYCANLKDNLDEIFDEVNDEVFNAVDSIRKTCESQLKRIEKIDADNHREVATKLMSESYYIMDVCILVDKLLQEA